MSYNDLVFTWSCGEPPDVNELHALMAVVRLSGGDGVCTVSADILAALKTACTHASHGVYFGQPRVMFTGLVPEHAAWRGVLATGQMQWLTSINGDGTATFFPCAKVDDETDETARRVTRFMNCMLELTFTRLRTKIPEKTKNVRVHIERRMRTLLPVIADTLDKQHFALRYLRTSEQLTYWTTHGLPPQCTYTFTQAGPTLW